MRGRSRRDGGRDTWTPELACCWMLLGRGLVESQGPGWDRVQSMLVTG